MEGGFRAIRPGVQKHLHSARLWAHFPWQAWHCHQHQSLVWAPASLPGCPLPSRTRPASLRLPQLQTPGWIVLCPSCPGSLAETWCKVPHEPSGGCSSPILLPHACLAKDRKPGCRWIPPCQSLKTRDYTGCALGRGQGAGVKASAGSQEGARMPYQGSGGVGSDRGSEAGSLKPAPRVVPWRAR